MAVSVLLTGSLKKQTKFGGVPSTSKTIFELKKEQLKVWTQFKHVFDLYGFLSPKEKKETITQFFLFFFHFRILIEGLDWPCGYFKDFKFLLCKTFAAKETSKSLNIIYFFKALTKLQMILCCQNVNKQSRFRTILTNIILV